MTAKLSEIITNFFIKRKLIQIEEKEIYCYSFELILAFVLNLSIVLAIGFGTLHFVETIIFLFVFLLIRTSAGGYHADTHFRCLLILSFIFVSFLLMVDFCAYLNVNISLATIGGVLLLVLPIADCEENKLNKKRKTKLKLKTIILVLIFLLCVAVCCIFDKQKIAMSFAYPMTIIAVSIIASFIKIKLKRRCCNEK